MPDKKEYIRETATKLLFQVTVDWDYEESQASLEDVAKECVKAAEMIWKLSNPLQ